MMYYLAKTLNPKSETKNPKPQTPQTLNPKLLNPKGRSKAELSTSSRTLQRAPFAAGLQHVGRGVPVGV